MDLNERRNSPRLRVLQVCSAKTLGGGEAHVTALAGELERRGHSVEVAGRRGGPLRLDHALPFRNALDLPSVLGLARIVGAGAFDVVHAHVARDYPIAAAALATLTGRSAPGLVLTRHLIHRLRWTPLYRRVDGWIATTGQIAQTLAHLQPRRVEVIPNWVDPGSFGFRERPLRRPVAVGLLGQVAPHKGHDDALEMIGKLGAGFALLVAGSGDDEYVAALRRRAQGLPVGFLGFVDRRSFLEDLDVLVLPSWEEPFGIVVLEAMAAGVNVVATNRGGPPEILDGGRAGLLVPPRDPAAMAGAVRTLVSDRALAGRLREAARRRVVECYDISPAVSRVEALYRDLVLP